MKDKVDNKSLGYEDISYSQTSILEDFVRMKQLVEEHYRIKEGKYGRPNEET